MAVDGWRSEVPVSSFMRLAARPVGAAKRIGRSCFFRRSQLVELGIDTDHPIDNGSLFLSQVPGEDKDLVLDSLVNRFFLNRIVANPQIFSTASIAWLIFSGSNEAFSFSNNRPIWLQSPLPQRRGCCQRSWCPRFGPCLPQWGVPNSWATVEGSNSTGRADSRRSMV